MTALRVGIAGWIGSTNLGDEMVLAGLLRLLAQEAPGAEVTLLSVSPAASPRLHDRPGDGLRLRAVPGSDPRAVLAAMGELDLLILGGGGLLQDRTSPFNLPYHLARVAAARLRRTPVVGLGLGVGPLTTMLGRAQARRALAGVPIAVRDAASADLLASVGLPRPTVAADLAVNLPDVAVDPVDRFTVALRPWSATRSLLPVMLSSRLPGRGDRADEVLLAGLARALDEVAHRTGLAAHLVALQPDRDGPLHDAVADRMTTLVTVARPGLHEVVAEVATGRVVLAMRYHAGIAAVLAGRPAVLIGYSLKVDALAAELGAGASLVPWHAGPPPSLVDRVEAVLPRRDVVLEGRAALRARATGNRDLLAQALRR